MSGLTGVLAITDDGWFEFLRDQPLREEVNFWKPSARRGMNVDAFTPFLFKLKAPHNAICGFGYFARFARLPPWLAWEAFGPGNGSASYEEMQDRVRTIRLRIGYKPPPGPDEIGCALIAEPVFFPEERWVRQPSDWPVRTQTEKRYDLAVGEGARVWQECLAVADELAKASPAVGEGTPRYGDPRSVRPRLGQGIFRIATTEAYERACALTGEHSLPALEAAHIKPYSRGGPHAVENGLLLRADLHRLYDRGYLTIVPEDEGAARVLVSDRLRDDFRNGKTYYPLRDARLRMPRQRTNWPSSELLRWHEEHVFVA